MAKKKEIPASDYPKGLREALEDLPHIETVYVKGNQWHFVKREDFTAVDRDDIMDTAPAALAEEAPTE